MARIEVRFLIDANGILNVAARDARTGKEQSVEVKPSYGLTEDQVQAMIASRSNQRRGFPRAAGAGSAGGSRRHPERGEKARQSDAWHYESEGKGAAELTKSQRAAADLPLRQITADSLERIELLNTPP
jgi:hypothetical protein